MTNADRAGYVMLAVGGLGILIFGASALRLPDRGAAALGFTWSALAVALGAGVKARKLWARWAAVSYASLVLVGSCVVLAASLSAMSLSGTFPHPWRLALGFLWGGYLLWALLKGWEDGPA